MSAKIIVSSISWATSDDSVRDAFSRYGDVIEAHVPFGANGRNRGFAIVTFASGEQANAAVDDMDEQELDGRTVRVQHASERQGF